MRPRKVIVPFRLTFNEIRMLATFTPEEVAANDMKRRRGLKAGNPMRKEPYRSLPPRTLEPWQEGLARLRDEMLSAMDRDP